MINIYASMHVLVQCISFYHVYVHWIKFTGLDSNISRILSLVEGWGHDNGGFKNKLNENGEVI